MGKKKASPTIDAEYVRTLIKSTVAKMGPEYSKKERKEQAQILQKIFERGITPQEAMQVSDVEMREIYHYGRDLFNSGKYAEAIEIFKMLNILNPLVAGFSLALGACYHKAKQYDYALRAYMSAAAQEPNNPIPLFYCYDCYLNQNDSVSAGIMLCNVIARAGDQPLYASIKAKAHLLLEPLEKAIVEMDKKKK